MNIIIFEGIAGSGKTTIEKLLSNQLKKAEIIPEQQTLMPLIKNRDGDIAFEHLEKLVEKIKRQKFQNLIIDRFHITHAFRTRVGIDYFDSIEKELMETGNVFLVLLTIDEKKIGERIKETIEYRKDEWRNIAQGANTIDEKIRYYVEQQKRLLELAKESNLPVIRIDTTLKEWEVNVQTILKEMKLC